MDLKKLTHLIFSELRKKNCLIIDCNKKVINTIDGHLVLQPVDEEHITESIVQSLEYQRQEAERSVAQSSSRSDDPEV